MSDDNFNTYIVYLLVNTSNNNNYTYLGITNNSKRRLRQHNGIIKGGAKYTNAFKGDGEWIYYLKIKNLTKSEALSIERTAKNKRKNATGIKPIDKRLDVLLPILDKYPNSICEYFTNPIII
jgi:predicted GIY-YIG superfamily endonuclease